jgi:uncharacterized cupredoxin-like copper-binding protein
MLVKVLVTTLLAIALSTLTFSPTTHAATAQIVSITLQDPSADPSISGMEMRTDTTSVKAGRVTLEAVNRSKDLVHEVLVVPAPSDGKQLPYDIKTNTIIEKRVHSLGEISELKPGAHGTLTLNLKPGTYLLLCNQPGHYKSGMRTKLVVEK